MSRPPVEMHGLPAPLPGRHASCSTCGADWTLDDGHVPPCLVDPDHHWSLDDGTALDVALRPARP